MVGGQVFTQEFHGRRAAVNTGGKHDSGHCLPPCPVSAGQGRQGFLSTLQALAAFGLAWLAFVPFWGNHGLWGAYLIFYAGRSFFLLRYWPRLRNAPFFRHDSAALR